jgi:hypothetical protein
MAINGLGTASGSGFVTQATLDATVGLVPITPTSIANSGGSASASGAAVTFSGVNSISLNNVFSSTYLNYRIIINQVQSAVIATYFRMRSSGTDVSGSVYWYGQSVAPASGSGPTNNSGSGVTAWDLYGGGTLSDYHALDIANPYQTVGKTITIAAVLVNGTTTYGVAGGGYTSDSSVRDGFTIYPGSGTTTGTIRVYGYRNS